MKVLSGNTTKTLTGGGMEPFIEFTPDGDAKISALSKPLHNGEDKLTHCSETSKWNLVRRLRRSSGLTNHRCQSDPDTKLFGQPLLKICAHDGSLPKPITEMLQLLWKKGPSTEGVFRKLCNIKNMKDIRDKLNNGLDVDMDEQPVVLLVGLLKSFLKELPGSLLVSDLYDSWMKALDSEDEMQRALEIKRVVDLLPVPNRLLLQHLVCILHRIHEHADTNKMDAKNLAVCIAPTLLQLDSTYLEEQRENPTELISLTQFLIEHFETLGENIGNLLDPDDDNADYLSSHYHDSAYDSTDPDGDGEPGECLHGVCGSSSSLCPSSASQSWTSDAIFHTSTKLPFNRRCSEPIILLSADVTNLCSHARSHDDCSVKRKDFEDQPLKKQVSDDSFLLKRRVGSRSALSFPKLYSNSNMESLYTLGNGAKDCSCSSLESSTSNQSEGSVFTSSPVGSPACPRRANSSNHSTRVQQEVAKPNPDEKRRSQSMRIVGNLPVRSRSLGAFTRRKKLDSQKENSFPCETLQEDSQSEAEVPTEHPHKPRPLSAIEVFKHVDSKLPCRPPPYKQALQNAGLPPQYRSMTVHDVIQLERRSHPSSVNYDSSPPHPANQYANCFSQVAQDEDRLVERRRPFRQRAMSESVSTTCHEGISRRFSQPVFEEFSYAKESYV
ncbi:T cell activation RhoGTPase activating protein b [Thalassophryne amazonica]|uniref:T cell activation RhoGTPase activating protein b n=1 Tax=Thalassophryne amazonica TaxID=390379 RepID=UPI0014721853|nr:T cell activation RhoGTPase activating protein b [Thalassophryne amazonica]